MKLLIWMFAMILDSEDFFYVSIILREVDIFFNIENDYNQIFPVDENTG